jgi:hypothetical protein
MKAERVAKRSGNPVRIATRRMGAACLRPRGSSGRGELWGAGVLMDANPFSWEHGVAGHLDADSTKWMTAA